ncbi:MAG: hypothetical protein NZ867_04350, partial [SAR324 cluster bacterium]|nr:hypothetical protein [SAR324 cluster bacterium]
FVEKCVCSVDSLGDVKKAGGSSMRVFPLDQVEKMYTEHKNILKNCSKTSKYVKKLLNDSLSSPKIY